MSAVDLKLKPALEPANGEMQRYYAQKQCSAQWRVFLMAISTEIFNHAQGGDAELFFREVGSEMARRMPLPQASSLPELQELMNDQLDGMDWGQVELSDSGKAIDVCHYAAPSSIAEDTREVWTRSLGYTLEGLYGHWFQEQGAAEHLRTKVVSNPAPGMFVLRHSR